MEPKYKRILLKLSGEALAGENTFGINFNTVSLICKQVKKCVDIGVQMGLVVGGGNFWRGRSNNNMNRTKADYIGMLATVMNSLAITDEFTRLNTKSVVQTSVNMAPFAEFFSCDRAIKYLNNGTVVIFGGGTGSPFFSTDTVAALRAAEINADIIMKATMVDGVYDKDPVVYADAIKYNNLKFQNILTQNLHIIDSTAASLCQESNIPLLVFSLKKPENIFKAVVGENIGTIIS